MKLTLGVMGLKITTLSQKPVNHKSIVKFKSFIILPTVVVPDNGALSYIKLFAHA